MKVILGIAVFAIACGLIAYGVTGSVGFAIFYTFLVGLGTLCCVALHSVGPTGMM